MAGATVAGGRVKGIKKEQHDGRGRHERAEAAAAAAG